MKKVIKNDGEIVEFDKNKISNSIFKSAKAIGGTDRERAKKMAKLVLTSLEARHSDKEMVTTNQIAEELLIVLRENEHNKTARAYELFRDIANEQRNIKSLIDADEIIQDYISQSDWRVKENSNMAFSWQGLNNHITSIVQSNYWLHSIYPKEIAQSHIDGDFHIHDLSVLGVYCCGWDLKDLLTHGFGGVPGKIHCAPPKHFKTALGQIVNFLYTLQGEAAGAEAFSNFDTYLAPFVRYDGLSYKEVKQSMQEFIFNMNVPTRVGFQAPFTNITMDLVPTGEVSEENVVIGGRIMPEQYKDFQKEMIMINKAFAEIMCEGDASGRVFTWPIPTYNITKDFDWDNPEYDPIWEMTRKYGTPYFSNYINSDMSPDDARSMCCRLRLDNRELKKRGGALFGSNPLTGSIGVVTINMPRLAYKSKSKDDFFEALGKLMDLAKDSLLLKRQVLEEFTERGLYPYSMIYLAKIKERFGEYWKNHFCTIGLNGMNEACLNLIDHSIADDEGREFALETLEFMRDRISGYQEKYDQIFNLEATPAEGTSYKLARKDKKEFGNIKVANEDNYRELGAEPYYSNSTQLPVDTTDDVFEALDHQDELQCMYTGGTVLHIFLGESMPSINSVKSLVRKACENYKLPYISITPTFSVCPKHGYLSGEHEYCPKCDVEIGYTPEETKVSVNNFSTVL